MAGAPSAAPALNILLEYLEELGGESNTWEAPHNYTKILAGKLEATTSTIGRHFTVLEGIKLVKRVRYLRDKGYKSTFKFGVRITVCQPGARVERATSGFYNVIKPQ